MKLLIPAVIILLTIIKLDALVKFTNLKCTTLDPSYSKFRYCKLKVPQRGQIAMNVYAELYKIPINKITGSLNLQKKANGYRPFLYNYTFDYCKFMLNKNRIPFMKILYDMQAHDTNLNHTCPYNHDLIVKNFVLREESFNQLPLPSGDYQFEIKVGIPPEHWKALLNVYFVVVEKK